MHVDEITIKTGELHGGGVHGPLISFQFYPCTKQSKQYILLKVFTVFLFFNIKCLIMS